MNAPDRSRRRPPAPPLVPALLLPTLLAVLCVLLGVALPAAAAGGAREAPAPPPTRSATAPPTAPSTTPSTTPSARPPAAGDGVVDVQVTSVAPQVVRPTDELVVRARVHNRTDEVLTAPRATLGVNRALLATRSSLQQWVDQPLDGASGTSVRPVDLPGPLEPGATVDVELRVPASALRLGSTDAAWGPRGLAVELADDGARQAISRTFMLWWPTEQEVTPTLLSVLVPLTGGPVDPGAVPPDGEVPDDEVSDEEPTDDAPSPATPGDAPAPVSPTAPSVTGETDGTGARTGSPTDAPAGSDPAPQPPVAGTGGGDLPSDALRAPDGDAQSSPAAPGVPGDETLGRLQDAVAATVGHPRVAWAIDPVLLAAARGSGDGAPAARWAAAVTSAAAGREVLALPAYDPDLAALAHAPGDELAAQAWARARATADPVLGSSPAADLVLPPTDVPDLATAAVGARHGATTLVVGGDGLAANRLTYTPTGRATVTTTAGDVAAVVADDVLSDQLHSPDGVTPATAAQRMLAETAVITRERPNEQRHLLAAAGRDWDPQPAVARAQLAGLGSVPWVRLAELSTLVAAPDPGVDRVALPDRQVADAEIDPAQVAAMLTARAELTAFAAILPDPARLLAGVDDALLATTAVAWRGEPAQRARVVDALVAEMRARSTGVTVVPGSELYLGSETGRFPLGLRNDLDQPVTIRVVVDPASPLLVIDEAQTVTIPAESETQVRVPFHAVGSGDVRVSVALLSPDGVPLGPAQQLTVRVRADWENVGTAVVAGLLGVALVVGIIRTVRRGQTRTRGAGATPVSEIARHPEDLS